MCVCVCVCVYVCVCFSPFHRPHALTLTITLTRTLTPTHPFSRPFLAGLRRDGRRNDNLREWEAVVGMIPHADGSAYARQGQTKVVAIVNGPKQVRGGV